MNAKLFIPISILVLGSCSSQQSSKETDIPKKLNDGWEVASLSDAGLKPEVIETSLNSHDPKLDAVLLVKDGKLVAEQYYNGYTIDKQHKVWSITKVITGIVTGIAIDEKAINSDKDSIYKYLGNYTIPKPSIKEITIGNILSMTSGFSWKELGGPGSVNYELPYQSDWIANVLSQPHSSPGKEFSYNTGSYMLLAAVIKNATGKQAEELAKEKLFGPLGISNYQWDKQSEFWTKTKGDELKGAREPGEIKYAAEFAAYSNTGSGLHMLPRDMAKIGQLHLDGGKWKGVQIISSDWVKRSTQEQFPGSEYGYGWRLRSYEQDGKKYDAWYASGFGQQAIIVIPSLQMVIVYAQHHYDSMPEGERLMNEQVSRFISAAAK